MIITEKKPFGIIKNQLEENDKIGIVSCNACARMCETGGKEGMEDFEKRLKQNGFEVVDKDLIGTACDFDQLDAKELHGNTTVVLACDAGVFNLKKLFPKRKIIAALDTIGLGAFDEKGNLNIVRKFE